MTEANDDIKDDVGNNQSSTEQKQDSTEHQYSDIEVRALEMGWRPKEEFQGNEEDFIDALEFVRRKPLFEKIEAQSRELKDIRKAIKDLSTHNARLAEVSYKQAMEDLKQQYKDALVKGDADQIADISEQIADKKAEEKVREMQATQQTTSQQPHPDFVAWVDKNSWYVRDPELRVRADRLGNSLIAMDPQKDPVEVLEEVTRRIKELYPNKFNNPYRPNAVDSGKNAPIPGRQSSRSSSEKFDMTDEERRVMDRLVRRGDITKEKYIEDLKKIKGL